MTTQQSTATRVPSRREVLIDGAALAATGAFGLLSRLLVVLFAATVSLALPAIALAQTAGQAEKPAIVLVHGAFADGSSWSQVIARLQAKGYRVIAQDLSPVAQGIIAATQVPWFSGCLTDKVMHAAWHDKPSWWVMGKNDHMIAPALQAQMAAHIKAKVTKVSTSHVAMLADPEAVTAVIIAAADQVQSGTIGERK